MEVVVTPQTGRVAGRRAITGSALHCEGQAEGQRGRQMTLDAFGVFFPAGIECPGSCAPTMPCTSLGEVHCRQSEG